jgi:putative ABC transport system substrate-binding protein
MLFFCLKKYFEIFGNHFLILGVAILATAGTICAKPAHVALVKSPVWNEYEQTSRSIVSSLGTSHPELSVEEIVFEAGSAGEEEFWQRVTEHGPELIVTVGTASTRSAINSVKNIPIVFTTVLDNFEALLAENNSADICGITLAIPVEEQLRVMKEALPYIRRVGYLYGRNSADVYQSAREYTSRRGIRLVAREIASERDIPQALREIIPEVDAFWVPLDAMIYYNQNIRHFILLECFQNSVPIMAVSKKIAIAGTPLAIDVDYEDIGRQTAELVLRKLAKDNRLDTDIHHPRKVLLYINKWVSSRLGLNIPPKVAEEAISISVKSGR